MIEPDMRGRLFLFFQKTMPFWVCFLCLVIGLVPLLGRFSVPFVYLGLFYWILFFPALLPPMAVFALGVLSDLMTAGVFGIAAFGFLIFYLLISMERRFFKERSFLFLWALFAFYAFLMMGGEWLLNGMFNGQFFGGFSVLARWFVLVFCYPVAVFLFKKADTFLEEDR